MELASEDRFQVGLVEAGKHGAGVGWDKERIEVVGMAVQALVVGGKRQIDDINAPAQRLVREQDVLVQPFRLEGLAMWARGCTAFPAKSRGRSVLVLDNKKESRSRPLTGWVRLSGISKASW